MKTMIAALHRCRRERRLRKPDQQFIDNYDTIVPDITELSNYNIGLQEVAEMP